MAELSYGIFPEWLSPPPSAHEQYEIARDKYLNLNLPGDIAAKEEMLSHVTLTVPDLDQIREMPWPGDIPETGIIGRRWLITALAMIVTWGSSALLIALKITGVI